MLRRFAFPIITLCISISAIQPSIQQRPAANVRIGSDLSVRLAIPEGWKLEADDPGKYALFTVSPDSSHNIRLVVKVFPLSQRASNAREHLLEVAKSWANSMLSWTEEHDYNIKEVKFANGSAFYCQLTDKTLVDGYKKNWTIFVAGIKGAECHLALTETKRDSELVNTVLNLIKTLELSKTSRT